MTDAVFPWSLPLCIPCREGETDASRLYEAMGRTISNWEGVEAAALVLFKEIESDDNKIDIFERTFRIAERAKQLQSSIECFFNARVDVQERRQEALDLVAAYQGWSLRRNDVAHGYVTPMWSPDYSRVEQPLTKTYSLCPSHTNPNKWSYGDPHYNLNASEIVAFAKAIAKLDAAFERLAKALRNGDPSAISGNA